MRKRATLLLGPCLLALCLTRPAAAQTTRDPIVRLAEPDVVASQRDEITAAATSKPAIYVSEFEVTDPEGIRPYSAGVEGTFLPFGRRYIVRGGAVTSLEGQPTRRIVMIAFPSVSQAQAWYDSPAYRALRPIRHRTATSKVFIVEGAAP